MQKIILFSHNIPLVEALSVYLQDTPYRIEHRYFTESSILENEDETPPFILFDDFSSLDTLEEDSKDAHSQCYGEIVSNYAYNYPTFILAREENRECYPVGTVLVAPFYAYHFYQVLETVYNAAA